MIGFRIAGTGVHLPGAPIDNARLRTALRRHPDGLSEDTQERILAETGIVTRHAALDLDDPDPARRESNTTMAAAAGRQAMAAAGWQPQDVELLVVTTVIPDHLMPPTSTLVQEALGIARCTELEISANCTAPTKGLMVAASQLQLGNCERALVCSSQSVAFLGMPPWTNPARMTADQGHLRWVLSDGAAALALERGWPDIELRTRVQSTGPGKRSGMSLPLGASTPDLAAALARGEQHVTQEVRYVLKEGVRSTIDGLARMFDELALDPAGIDHFIPSVSSMQLVRRLRPLFAERLGIPEDAWRLNFTRVGYVGSVAVPIVLDELVRAGTLRPGDRVVTVAEESSKWMFAGATFRWNP
jgi:3-oxoacyl-[acyl-carrier-protein] synthase-3